MVGKKTTEPEPSTSPVEIHHVQTDEIEFRCQGDYVPTLDDLAKFVRVCENHGLPGAKVWNILDDTGPRSRPGGLRVVRQREIPV